MPPSPEDIDALLSDVAAATDALRSASGADASEVARKLLGDLTRVAARLRADAAAIGESLAGVLDAVPQQSDTAGDP